LNLTATGVAMRSVAGKTRLNNIDGTPRVTMLDEGGVNHGNAVPLLVDTVVSQPNGGVQVQGEPARPMVW
jgi:hypothetical protein